MTRRKVILPNWTVSEENSNDKELLLKAFDDLSYGEIVVNIKHSGVTLTTLDENGEIAKIESSIIVDEKINKETLRAKSEEGRLDVKIVDSFNSAITYTNDSLTLLLSGATEAFDTLKEVEDWINSHSGQTIDIIKDINGLNGNLLILSGATIGFSGSTVKEIERLDTTISEFSAATVDNISRIDRDVIFVSGVVFTLNDKTDSFSASTVAEISRLDKDIKFISGSVSTLSAETLSFSASTISEIERIDADTSHISGSVVSISAITDAFSASTLQNIKRIDGNVTSVSGGIITLSASTKTNVDRIDTNVSNLSAVTVNFSASVETTIGKTLNDAKTYTDQQIDFVVSGASEAFDTLKEVETWINNHSGETKDIIGDINSLYVSAHTHSNKALLDTYAQTETNLADAVAKKHEHSNKTILDGITAEKVAAWDGVSEKVDKVSGKGLSTNDFTDELKTKLDGIAAGAEVNVQSDWNATSGDALILNKPSLATVATSGNYNDLTNKPTLFSGNYNDLSNKPTIPNAVTDSTVANWGYTKNIGTITGINMNGVSKGTYGVIDLGTVITSLDGYAKESQIPDISGKVDKVSGKGLSTNDFTNELKNKLDGIASGAEVNVQSDWNATSGDALILNKPSLAAVATSGNYNDLSNKPTIPSVDGFIKNISLAPSTETLYIVGSTLKTASTTSLSTSSADVYISEGQIYVASDETLKNFGKNIEVDFDKLAEIPKVYYTWKTDADNKQQIGTSAQKLREIYPELVSENEDGKLAVSYEKLSVIALAAVDKLHKENEELKDRLKRIEEKLGL